MSRQAGYRDDSPHGHLHNLCLLQRSVDASKASRIPLSRRDAVFGNLDAIHGEVVDRPYGTCMCQCANFLSIHARLGTTHTHKNKLFSYSKQIEGTLTVTNPQRRFLNMMMGGFLSSGLYAIELYGGLCMFMLYIVFDTQMIIEDAHQGRSDFVAHAMQLLIGEKPARDVLWGLLDFGVLYASYPAPVSILAIPVI
jgi:hypothetical protein